MLDDILKKKEVLKKVPACGYKDKTLLPLRMTNSNYCLSAEKCYYKEVDKQYKQQCKYMMLLNLK